MPTSSARRLADQGNQTNNPAKPADDGGGAEGADDQGPTKKRRRAKVRHRSILFLHLPMFSRSMKTKPTDPTRRLAWSLWRHHVQGGPRNPRLQRPQLQSPPPAPPI